MSEASLPHTLPSDDPFGFIHGHLDALRDNQRISVEDYTALHAWNEELWRRFGRNAPGEDAKQVTEQSIREAMDRVEKQGPCAMHGAGYAAHRLVDSEMGAFYAGDTLDAVLDAFHKEGSVSAMLSRWIAVSILTKYGMHADEREPETSENHSPSRAGHGEPIERKHAGCGGTFRILDSRVTCERCGTPYSAATIDVIALAPACENGGQDEGDAFTMHPNDAEAVLAIASREASRGTFPSIAQILAAAINLGIVHRARVAQEVVQGVEVRDGTAYIIGIPAPCSDAEEASGEGHNCDDMGCPSAGGHTLYILPIEGVQRDAGPEITRDQRRSMRHYLDERLHIRIPFDVFNEALVSGGARLID